MATIVVHTQGALIEARSKHLSVLTPNGVRREIPLLSIDRIYCYGKVQVTTRAIHLLAMHGKDLVYFSKRGRYRARLLSNPCSGVALRMRQYAIAQDKSRSLKLARALVAAKIQNQIAVLKRLTRNHAVFETERIAPLERLAGQALLAPSAESLLGVEGSASRMYFPLWAACCGKDFEWQGRSTRPPRDPLNILLSLGYTLLTNDLHSQLLGVGFDAWLGFLHSSGPAKPALALDLMEPFRPLVIDRLIQDLCVHRRIKSEDFTTERETEEDPAFDDPHADKANEKPASDKPDALTTPNPAIAPIESVSETKTSETDPFDSEGTASTPPTATQAINAISENVSTATDDSAAIPRLSTDAFRVFFVAYEKRMQRPAAGELDDLPARNLLEAHVRAFTEAILNDRPETYQPPLLRT